MKPWHYAEEDVEEQGELFPEKDKTGRRAVFWVCFCLGVGIAAITHALGVW